MIKNILLHRGVTIPEVLFSLALLAITFLSLMGVLTGGLRADKKGYIKDNATAVAHLLLARSLQEAEERQGVFWSIQRPDRNAPYKKGTETSGEVVFEYEICTSYVTGDVPQSPGHRLMLVDVYVHWGSDDSRVGYGDTVTLVRRLVSEASGHGR